MKRIFALAILALGLLTASCGKLESEIHIVDIKTDEVENTNIATIEEQISAIKVTIASLTEAKEAAEANINSINEEIQHLSENDSDYTEKLAEFQKALEKAMEIDKALEEPIEKLNEYLLQLQEHEKLYESSVADSIAANRQWMEDTFATMEQLKYAAEVLAFAQAINENADAVIQERLYAAEASLLNWLNGRLVEEFISAMEFDKRMAEMNLTEVEFQYNLDSLNNLFKDLSKKLEDSRKAIETSDKDVRDSLERERAAIEAEIESDWNNIEEFSGDVATHEENLKALQAALEQLKIDIINDCDSVAKEAILDLRGVITKELSDKIDSLNNAKAPLFKELDNNIALLDTATVKIENEIADIQTRIAGIQQSLTDISTRLSAFDGIVQSITYVPELNDNPRILEWGADQESIKGGCPVLNFMVRPAAMADTIYNNQSNLEILAKRSQMTKASVFDQPLTIQSLSVADAENGIISITVGTEEQLVSALKGGDISLCLRYKDGKRNNVTSDFANLGTEIPKRRISVYDSKDKDIRKEIKEFSTLNLILPWDHTPAQYTIYPEANPEASASLFTYISADSDIAGIENASSFADDLTEDQLDQIDEMGLSWLSYPEGVITVGSVGSTTMFIKVPTAIKDGATYKASTFEFTANVIESKLRFNTLKDMDPMGLFDSKPETQSVTMEINDNGTWRNVTPEDNISFSYKITAPRLKLFENSSSPIIKNLLEVDVTESMRDSHDTMFDATKMLIQYGTSVRDDLGLAVKSKLVITATKQMDGYTDQVTATVTLNSGGLF